MHPSKVTLRPKVRRPMAWDSTKSAPSAQQPEPSTQCPIPGGYRRAETRHHRIDHPARLREDAQQPDMIAAIPLRHCALRATTGCLRRNPPLATAHRAQKLDSLRSGGGRVDATGAWLVGAKGEYPINRNAGH